MPPAARRRDSPHARPWLILVVAALAALRLLVRFVLRRRVRKARAAAVAVVVARACALTPAPHAAGRRRLLPPVHQRRRRRRACAVVRAACCADSCPPLLLPPPLTRRRSPGVPCVPFKPQLHTSRCGCRVTLPARARALAETRNCLRSTSTPATPRPLQSWQSARTRSSACHRCVRWRACGCGAAAQSWRSCTL